MLDVGCSYVVGDGYVFGGHRCGAVAGGSAVPAAAWAAVGCGTAARCSPPMVGAYGVGGSVGFPLHGDSVGATGHVFGVSPGSRSAGGLALQLLGGTTAPAPGCGVASRPSVGAYGVVDSVGIPLHGRAVDAIDQLLGAPCSQARLVYCMALKRMADERKAQGASGTAAASGRTSGHAAPAIVRRGAAGRSRRRGVPARRLRVSAREGDCCTQREEAPTRRRQRACTCEDVPRHLRQDGATTSPPSAAESALETLSDGDFGRCERAGDPFGATRDDAEAGCSPPAVDVGNDTSRPPRGHGSSDGVAADCAGRVESAGARHG